MRHILAALVALFLTHASAQADTQADTEAETKEQEGGIIGTGIVGTITHLGSLYVNGQHIRIDKAQQVSGSLAQMTAGDLRPGHVVAATVELQGTSWRVINLRQIFPLIGPVEAVTQTTLSVLGTQVALGAVTATVQPGDWVAVSGLWPGQVVKASRLERVQATGDHALISGTYFGQDVEGRNVIGGTTVTGITATHLDPGDVVRISGRPVAGGIEAHRLERHLFDQTVALIQVEGYLSAPQPSGLYTMFGSGLVAYTDQPDMIDVEKRVILCGADGRFGVPDAGGEEQQRQKILLEQLNCRP